MGRWSDGGSGWMGKWVCVDEWTDSSDETELNISACATQDMVTLSSHIHP